MVTHGYVIFKYKGVYYNFYNHSDSYCSCLGQRVVAEIIEMLDGNHVEYYKQHILRMPFRDEKGEGLTYFHSIHYSIVEYDDSYYTSDYETGSEYTYIIDFDEDEFIVNKYDNRYTFHLFNIPDNWEEIVEKHEEYMYEHKEELSNDKIKRQIKELEVQITELKSRLTQS